MSHYQNNSYQQNQNQYYDQDKNNYTKKKINKPQAQQKNKDQKVEGSKQSQANLENKYNELKKEVDQNKNSNNKIDEIKTENKLLNNENSKLVATSKLQNEKFEKMQKNFENSKKDFKKQLGEYNLDSIIKKKQIDELKETLEKVNIQTKLQELQLQSIKHGPTKDNNTDIIKEKISNENDENVQKIKNELQSLKEKYDELEYKQQLNKNISTSISDLGKEIEFQKIELKNSNNKVIHSENRIECLQKEYHSLKEKTQGNVRIVCDYELLNYNNRKEIEHLTDQVNKLTDLNNYLQNEQNTIKEKSLLENNENNYNKLKKLNDELIVDLNNQKEQQLNIQTLLENKENKLNNLLNQNNELNNINNDLQLKLNIKNETNEETYDIEEVMLNKQDVIEQKEEEINTKQFGTPENIPKLNLENNTGEKTQQDYDKQTYSRSLTERLPESQLNADQYQTNQTTRDNIHKRGLSLTVVNPNETSFSQYPNYKPNDTNEKSPYQEVEKRKQDLLRSSETIERAQVESHERIKNLYNNLRKHEAYDNLIKPIFNSYQPQFREPERIDEFNHQVPQNDYYLNRRLNYQ